MLLLKLVVTAALIFLVGSYLSPRSRSSMPARAAAFICAFVALFYLWMGPFL